MKSTSRRRPNPPPSRVVLDVDLIGQATRPQPRPPACAHCCTWVPTYRSQRSALTSAVQFMGSMVACASSGNSYTADDRARSALERRRRVALGPRDQARIGLGRFLRGPPEWRHYRAARSAPGSQVIFKRLARLQGLPEMVGDHHHAARGREHPAHAGHRLRRGRVHATCLAAQHRTLGERPRTASRQVSRPDRTRRCRRLWPAYRAAAAICRSSESPPSA